VQAREPRPGRVAGLARVRGSRPVGAGALARAALPRALRAERDRGLGPGHAYEALARAHALAGAAEAALWKAKARAAGDAIADREDREHFEADFSTLP
jgi:hypothetical protein